MKRYSLGSKVSKRCKEYCIVLTLTFAAFFYVLLVIDVLTVVHEQPIELYFLERGTPLTVQPYSDDAAEDFFLLDINKATYEEILALPGIGKDKAKAIIEYRRENGAFKQARDILDIECIDFQSYQKFKHLITT